MKTNGMLTIGQTAKRTGVPPKTIRFYEEIGLIVPAERLENRYRTYGDNDVQTLCFIRRARGLGFSIADVAGLLSLYRDRGRASAEVRRLALSHIEELERRVDDLKAIRDAIADLIRRCHGDDRPECPILDELGATTH